MANCTNCEKILPDIAKFCPYCGTQVKVRTSSAAIPSGTPPKEANLPASPRLIALDFGKDIQQLTEDFEGREWVFSDVENWISSTDIPFFFLTGEAGIGKSTIAARLTQMRADIVVAHHFCIAGRGETIVPGTVLRSLAAQLGRNLEGYGEALANTIDPTYVRINVKIHVGNMSGGEITGVVINNLTVASPKQEMESLIRAPLTVMPSPTRPVLIVLDSLDEAFTYGERENLVSLLSGLNNLPRWVRILVTSRPEKRVMSYFTAIPKRVIATESKDNRDDLLRYVQKRVERTALKARLQAAPKPIDPNELVTQISGLGDDPGLASGNFLFTKFLLNDIESGAQPLDDLAKLPKSLDEIYTRFLLRLDSERRGWWETRYQPLLVVLAAAREPLTSEQLAGFAEHSARLLGGEMSATLTNAALSVLVQFLDVRGEQGHERYAIFHQSLRDFLTDPGRSGRFACPPKDGHRTISTHYLTRAGQRWDRCDEYGLRHLPAHLAGAQKEEDLRVLLTEFDWLRVKLHKIGIDALISDYNVLETEGGKQSFNEKIRSALRRSAQTLNLDQDQLAAQLTARLGDFKEREIQKLLQEAGKYRETPWLRPLTASLADERSVRWLSPEKEGYLEEIAFSTNGQWGAHVGGSFGPEPRSIILWDLTKWQSSGSHFTTVPRLNPFAMALSDDARWCLYSDSIGGVHRLDALTGEVWNGQAHRDLTIAKLIAISSNGQRALSTCQHGRMVAWEFEAGQHEIIIDESKNTVDALWMDAQGSRGVAAHSDGWIEQFDLWPARRHTLYQANSRPSALAVSADYLILAVATEDCRVEIRFLSAVNLPAGAIQTHGKPTCMAISRDNTHLAVGTEKGTVEVWNLENMTQTALYRDAHANEVKRIIFSKTNGSVISADYQHIKDWPIEADNVQEQEPEVTRAAGQVKVEPGSAHALAVLEDGSLGMWNMQTGKLESILTKPAGSAFGDEEIGHVKGLVLAKNIRRVLAWNQKLLCVWDLDRNGIVESLQVQDAKDADLSIDGRDVVFVNGLDISHWRPDENQLSVLGKYDLDPPAHVVISPDGESVLSSGGDRRVFRWPLHGIQKRALPEALSINDVVFYVDENVGVNYWYPDARDKPATMAFAGIEEAVVASGDGELFLLKMGAESYEKFQDNADPLIKRILVLEDEKLFVTSSLNSNVMKWSLDARRRTAIFSDHPGTVEQLSKTTQRAVIITRDGVLKIISLRNGSLIAAFQGDKSIVSCAGDDELEWIAALDQAGKMHFFHLEGTK